MGTASGSVMKPGPGSPSADSLSPANWGQGRWTLDLLGARFLPLTAPAADSGQPSPSPSRNPSRFAPFGLRQSRFRVKRVRRQAVSRYEPQSKGRDSDA